jgi:hypothetical protein
LNEHWFLGLDDTRDKVDSWREDYNTERPHSALSNLTPEEFATSKILIKEEYFMQNLTKLNDLQ